MSSAIATGSGNFNDANGNYSVAVTVRPPVLGETAATIEIKIKKGSFNYQQFPWQTTNSPIIYGVNKDAELLIRDWFGSETGVANFNRNALGATCTTRIYA